MMHCNDKYQELFLGLPFLEATGEAPERVSGITFDSRECAEGMVFVAIRGAAQDGFQYVGAAVERGASVVVSEQPVGEGVKVRNVVVRDAAAALGELAARYYGRPSEKLQLVGVTGTNGKTTIATELYHAWRALGKKAGLISTIEDRVDERVEPTQRTTPDPVTLNRLLAEMVDAGCEYACMEVSSHAVVQQRIAGLRFAGGVFTNLTHDHLDYHKTMKAYSEAKQQFFTGLPEEAFALTNADDKYGRFMVSNAVCRKYLYSCLEVADFSAKIREESIEGMELSVDGRDVIVRLLGRYNAYNLLAVYGVLQLQGFEQGEVLRVLSGLRPVAGRFDYQVGPRGEVVVVDYAHTPDALKNVIETIDQLRGKKEERLIIVFGCGGDRDHSKRPEMGEVAGKSSQWLVLTSDNPRSEAPEAIIREILDGVPQAHRWHTLVEPDRRKAIAKAIMLAQPNDWVLVAGKGHETYQEVQGQRHHFDDREEVRQVLQLLRKEGQE